MEPKLPELKKYKTQKDKKINFLSEYERYRSGSWLPSLSAEYRYFDQANTEQAA
ncbi:MAG: hypothetical protein QUV04_08510 [Synechococcus sp. WH 8007]|nr:hypothetical protein [Synechococcus sp. WH 8007]